LSCHAHDSAVRRAYPLQGLSIAPIARNQVADESGCLMLPVQPIPLSNRLAVYLDHSADLG
jgi:hypothetical protein